MIRLTARKFRLGLCVLALMCCGAMLLPVADFNGGNVTLWRLANARGASSAWALLCQGGLLLAIAIRVRSRGALRGAALALLPISLATVAVSALTLTRLRAGLCIATQGAADPCDIALNPAAWVVLGCAPLPALLGASFLWLEFRTPSEQRAYAA